MHVAVKEDKNVSCHHPNTTTEQIHVELTLDKRVLLPFKVTECSDCNAVFATDEQREHNSGVYHNGLKSYDKLTKGDYLFV